MKREKNAFSMIEFIFVIVILGILAALAIPKINIAKEKSISIDQNISNEIEKEVDYFNNLDLIRYNVNYQDSDIFNVTKSKVLNNNSFIVGVSRTSNGINSYDIIEEDGERINLRLDSEKCKIKNQQIFFESYFDNDGQLESLNINKDQVALIGRKLYVQEISKCLNDISKFRKTYYFNLKENIL